MPSITLMQLKKVCLFWLRYFPGLLFATHTQRIFFPRSLFHLLPDAYFPLLCPKINNTLKFVDGHGEMESSQVDLISDTEICCKHVLRKRSRLEGLISPQYIKALWYESMKNSSKDYSVGWIKRWGQSFLPALHWNNELKRRDEMWVSGRCAVKKKTFKVPIYHILCFIPMRCYIALTLVSAIVWDSICSLKFGLRRLDENWR